MNRVRATILLCYLLIAFLVIGLISSIWYRAHDPMWVGDMAESGQNFDILSLGLIIFGVVSAYGLSRRSEWGRMLAMSFSFVALFNYVGMRFLTPFLAPEIGIHITWETVLVGVLSTACLVGLSLGKIGNDG